MHRLLYGALATAAAALALAIPSAAAADTAAPTAGPCQDPVHVCLRATLADAAEDVKRWVDVVAPIVPVPCAGVEPGRLAGCLIEWYATGDPECIVCLDPVCQIVWGEDCGAPLGARP